MADTPSIIAFSGHMTDAPGRESPRFPEVRVPEVRKRIRAVLERQRRPLLGVSSAARGGDLLFIDEVLALGGRATVVLPFPPADFKLTSVGQGWNAEFDRLLGSDRVDLRPPLYPEAPAARRTAYVECNDRIVDVAAQLAEHHGTTDALFLALYKQSEADQAGGTMDAFERWKKTGGRFELIEP